MKIRIQGKESSFLKSTFLLGLMLIIPTGARGQNPVCPPGVYTADPSARVWDNMLYIYGSTDQDCDYYCSWHHDIMYTSDLVKWNLAERVFASKGENDEVEYNDNLLFAPDCMKSGGQYYLFYCQPGRQAEGLAVADNPLGPFTGGREINTGAHKQIDPAVFVDDDGSAYYLWGQFTLKLAKLRENMTELDLSSLRDSVLTEDKHYFHEGAYMTKRNGIYYIVYADISREERPTCIGYATSKNVWGPYSYQGVIIDNAGCNPGNWNNHGSIAEFNKQWYVFYHRSSHGCNKMRKTCVEKIFFDKNGLIPEVEMTSQGAGPPLNAFSEIDAARACLLHGNVRIVAEDESNEILESFHNNDAAIFKYLDFGKEATKISLRIKVNKKSRLVLSAGKPWSKRLLDVELDSTGNKWEVLELEINKISGIHSLWIQSYGEGAGLFDIDWLRFY